ncbi:MAG: flagellar motor protein MotA [Polynucleobacter sp. 24-46-87]|jgi:biopolymer transport protein ExbB|uniref:MotA/TolQ/ExbB proton channel family protein n=1 Tax=unclassified Polynucleobacter TaxID=2640945 RepID=UPI000BCE65F9|nr:MULTISPECIES: MotA/TolQ/ExbB proton channel family protein [unclassified Polynucleobacter]OYY20748.1 MAG: flagellar motor protein MotA [Polynucleobacter sp. 35-46-11]OZA14743.1 MAG: flagellar motor protein MotA [Polynucleobacter sp. 24-46-87]OZA77013.1 MAG: flagellar motor protein MotA [Polynucleobacter sp. 39-46-10]
MYSILLSAGWPIWPLLIISIIGLAIAIERAWYLRQIHLFPKDSLERVFGVANAISQQKAVSEAEIGAIGQLSPITPLFTCILREKVAGSPADCALEELQASAQSTWFKLDRYLGALATIATVAPLLGLFGTVVGMIEIFGSQGVGSPQQLAHGISIALYNTAFGLLIAIPALAAWRGLRAMANQRQHECEEFTRQLFKKLYPHSADTK